MPWPAANQTPASSPQLVTGGRETPPFAGAVPTEVIEQPAMYAVAALAVLAWQYREQLGRVASRVLGRSRPKGV